MAILQEAVELAFDLLKQLTNVLEVVNISADFPVAEFFDEQNTFKSKLIDSFS